LQKLAEQIFEIAPGFIIRKLGRRDILNCIRSFFVQEWQLEILEIALVVFILKQLRVGGYILNCDCGIFFL
jgi:hypothetical protein